MAKAHVGELRVGCSGWEYGSWLGDFYPAGLPRTLLFAHYASVFDTVELNNSFYKLPTPAAVAGWRKQAPAGFIYAMKASRYLTHMKKLKDPDEPLERIFARAFELGPHLGPVLYQFPPRWRKNVERLEGLIARLPRGVRHVVEFREPSWYADDVYRALENGGVAMCIHDMHDSASPLERIGPFAYVRFHGTAGKYAGAYTMVRLRTKASWLAAQRRAGIDVYAYFNNDVGGHAPRDALSLRRWLERHVED